MKSETVVIAMSGGVDSSVAAALLVEQGYHVIGMMLKLWSEPGAEDTNRCCTPESMSLAQRVAAKLKIPFYAIDIREKFKNSVVEFFVNGYAQNTTPNPCMLCNKQVRFGMLLQHALAFGATHLATGHYARIRQMENGRYQLLRGKDTKKDQSYVLSVLNQQQLSQALFPVGEYEKSEIRALARKFAIPVAERADSQDLCFLAGGDYRDFLMRNAPHIFRPGPIKNTAGEVIGQHEGLANYTIGQRKGLGVASQIPLYVLTKHGESNTLVVGRKEEAAQSALIARNANWINSDMREQPFTGEVKIRYQAAFQPATITPMENDSFRVDFENFLTDITPGQHAVVYQGENCIANGIITAQIFPPEQTPHR